MNRGEATVRGIGGEVNNARASDKLSFIDYPELDANKN
jgi:hypothetical protein